MVIADFDVVRIAFYEPKTNAPLVVHGDGVLAFAVILQRVKAVARWHLEVVEVRSQVDVLEFAGSSPSYISWEAGGLSRQEQPAGTPWLGSAITSRYRARPKRAQ